MRFLYFNVKINVKNTQNTTNSKKKEEEKKRQQKRILRCHNNVSAKLRWRRKKNYLHFTTRTIYFFLPTLYSTCIPLCFSTPLSSSVFLFYFNLPSYFEFYAFTYAFYVDFIMDIHLNGFVRTGSVVMHTYSKSSNNKKTPFFPRSFVRCSFSFYTISNVCIHFISFLERNKNII